MTPPPENRGATRRPRLRAVPRVEAADPAPDLTADPMADPMTDPAWAAVAPPSARTGEPDPRALRRLRRRARLARARVAPDFEEDPVVLPDAPEAAPQAAPVPPRARPKARHWGVLASFALLVLAPFAVSAWYLYARAADQYHSQVAFSIRSEEGSSAVAAGILGALTQIGSGSASDTDILFEYIRSQRIVEEIDEESDPGLDLRAMFRKAPGDPVFTLGEDDSIEALVAEWNRKVEVGYDSTGGIVHVRANAFTPEDAQAIAEAILVHSSALVNRLSDQAREDAVRYARDELAESEARLKGARQALADFRRANRIVDPGAEAGGQMGLLNALEAELAQALVDRDVMLSYAEPTDQRVVQVGRRIDAIRERIDAERASLGLAEGSSGALPDVLSAYEALQVDLEFANTAYTRSLAALTGANAEARRQSRYLAPHIEPTQASTALYPRRLLLAGLVGLFLLLGWGVAMLIYYNARDNR